MTDTMKIVIAQAPEGFSETLAYFVTELEQKSLISGKSDEWTLPQIQTSGQALGEVRVQPDSAIAAQISFDSKTKTIAYIGGEIESVNIGKIFQIKITLVNGAGKNLYSQSVLIYASDDPPLSAATLEDLHVSAANTKVEEDKKAIENSKNQIEKVDSAKESKYSYITLLETSTTELLYKLRLK